jgi:hypothetical protein
MCDICVMFYTCAYACTHHGSHAHAHTYTHTHTHTHTHTCRDAESPVSIERVVASIQRRKEADASAVKRPASTSLDGHVKYKETSCKSSTDKSKKTQQLRKKNSSGANVKVSTPTRCGLIHKHDLLSPPWPPPPPTSHSLCTYRHCTPP